MLIMYLALSKKAIKALYDLIPDFLSLRSQNLTYLILDPPIVVLIYISLVANDIEYIFICLLAICMSSLERCLFRSSAQFLVFFFFYLYLAIQKVFSLM